MMPPQSRRDVRVVAKHFSSPWSRRLTIRTEGLFKKANELFKLESPKIAVLVSSGAHFHGYLSHGPGDWPELHQLVASQGMVLATPEDFETVSQRSASRSQSVSSTARSSITVDDGGQDPILQRLAILEEEFKAKLTGPSPSTWCDTSISSVGTGQNPPTQPWSPPHTPEIISEPPKARTYLTPIRPKLVSGSMNHLDVLPSQMTTGYPSRSRPSTPDKVPEIVRSRPLSSMEARVHKKGQRSHMTRIRDN